MENQNDQNFANSAVLLQQVAMGDELAFRKLLWNQRSAITEIKNLMMAAVLKHLISALMKNG